MDLAINNYSYAEVSPMKTTSRICKNNNESKLVVQPRLTITKEKMKRISDRSLARYLSAAEKITD